MTQRQLWFEYCDEVEAQGGTAYSYSRFCAKLMDQPGSWSGYGCDAL